MLPLSSWVYGITNKALGDKGFNAESLITPLPGPKAYRIMDMFIISRVLGHYFACFAVQVKLFWLLHMGVWVFTWRGELRKSKNSNESSPEPSNPKTSWNTTSFRSLNQRKELLNPKPYT